MKERAAHTFHAQRSKYQDESVPDLGLDHKRDVNNLVLILVTIVT
jgi:hypothetical protein